GKVGPDLRVENLPSPEPMLGTRHLVSGYGRVGKKSSRLRLDVIWRNVWGIWEALRANKIGFDGRHVIELHPRPSWREVSAVRHLASVSSVPRIASNSSICAKAV